MIQTGQLIRNLGLNKQLAETLTWFTKQMLNYFWIKWNQQTWSTNIMWQKVNKKGIITYSVPKIRCFENAFEAGPVNVSKTLTFTM